MAAAAAFSFHLKVMRVSFVKSVNVSFFSSFSSSWTFPSYHKTPLICKNYSKPRLSFDLELESTNIMGSITFPLQKQEYREQLAHSCHQNAL